MLDSAALVAAVMAAVPADGMDPGEVIDTIERTARTDSGSSWRLPVGMNARMFRKHLIHQGALQLNDNDNPFCPIPNLRTWLVNRVPATQGRIGAETVVRRAPGKKARPSQVDRERDTGAER